MDKTTICPKCDGPAWKINDGAVLCLTAGCPDKIMETQLGFDIAEAQENGIHENN